MTNPHPHLGTPPKLATGGLRIVALGGIAEIGRNMTVYESKGKLLIVDCGVLFPEDNQPGIDLILPDFSYIHRMGIVFFASAFGCYITSLLQGYQDQPKAIDLKGIDFSTSKSFNFNAVIIVGILTIIYGIFSYV